MPEIDHQPHSLTNNDTPHAIIWKQFMLHRGYKSNESRLIPAVQRRKIHGVRALPEMVLSPDLSDCSRVWILSYAINNQDREMVELLLNHGVDPNKRDIPYKINILDYAFFDGRMTQRMILAGADLSEPRDIQNNVFRMDIETVRMALEKMGSVSLPRSRADTFPDTVCRNPGESRYS